MQISGSLNITGSDDVIAVRGNTGDLFTVSDELSGSLFRVNTVAGIPAFEVKSDYSVGLGMNTAVLKVNADSSINIISDVGPYPSEDFIFNIQSIGIASNHIRLTTDGTHAVKPKIQFDSGLAGTNRVNKATIKGGYDSVQSGAGGSLFFYTADTSEDSQLRMDIDSGGRVYIPNNIRIGSDHIANDVLPPRPPAA